MEDKTVICDWPILQNILEMEQEFSEVNLSSSFDQIDDLQVQQGQELVQKVDTLATTFSNPIKPEVIDGGKEEQTAGLGGSSKRNDVKEGKKEKRPRKRGKGSKTLLIHDFERQTVCDCDKRGDRARVTYINEELEALRYIQMDEQKKKWIEAYCRLEPDAAMEYDSLIGSTHSPDDGNYVNFDTRPHFANTHGNNEVQNMKKADHGVNGSEENYCEEDESDSEHVSIQRPAFMVTGEPDFDPGPPQDGLEYLRRVIRETDHIPKVKVARIEKRVLNKEQTVYMPNIPDIAVCPDHLKPSKEWEDAFLVDFSNLSLSQALKPNTTSDDLVPRYMKDKKELHEVIGGGKEEHIVGLGVESSRNEVEEGKKDKRLKMPHLNHDIERQSVCDCDKRGDRARVTYSNEELEALRYIKTDEQKKKKWSEAYSGLAPDAEYYSLSGDGDVLEDENQPIKPSNDEFSNEHKMAFDLSEDVRDMILSRISLPFILRFRVLSKSVYSRISSPYFMHLHTSQSTQKLLFRHRCSYDDGPFVDFWTVQGQLPLDTRGYNEVKTFEAPYTYNCNVLGSCNGVVLMSDSEHGVISLWNPSIRRTLTLPHCPARILVATGFGFDTVSDDYKIVCLSTQGSYVYALKKRAWCAIPSVPPSYNRLLSDVPCLLKGSLYWLVECMEKVSYGLVKRRCIIAFDLSTDLIRTISSPETIQATLQFSQITSIQGSLAVISKCSEDDETCIWMRRDADWVVVFKTNSDQFQGRIMPLKDDLLFFETCFGDFQVYNPESGARSMLEAFGVGCRIVDVVPYVDSLHLLDTATAVGVEQPPFHGDTKKQMRLHQG